MLKSVDHQKYRGCNSLIALSLITSDAEKRWSQFQAEIFVSRGICLITSDAEKRWSPFQRVGCAVVFICLITSDAEKRWSQNSPD